MKKSEEIVQYTAEDVKRYTALLKKASYSDDKSLNKILDYVFKDMGKQVRPHLVFLGAKLFGEVNEKTDYAAVLVQTLHTATLMHDDVVDDASLRRGKKTVNAEWRNSVAILVGDYLFSNALTIATQQKMYDILEILSPTVSQLSIGEINQMELAGGKSFSEDKYFNIIKRKTAMLIGASTESGAVSIGVNEEQREIIREVGIEAGMAFQIQDDILDFTADSTFGKSKGKDLEEKKITLPLIYALNSAPMNETKAIVERIQKGVNCQDIKTIVQFIESYGGIDYAKNCMQNHISKAESLLDKLPQNEANQSMRALIRYFAFRKK
ncbi:MAG: polyprenyl synthetase family protein [Bacteroidota bacterium]|nr:polyprenyl synthetase family protein [Bacteroidota bacterium]